MTHETQTKFSAMTNEDRFWCWMRPSLPENWLRGVVGEFLVAKALGLTQEPRVGWLSWDLKTKDGVRIEVKTSGYLQRWHEQADKESRCGHSV